jgi:NAD+ synthase (glutamine-hydrolysing)
MSGAIKIVQMNPTAGRISENLDKIILEISKADPGTVVVFPEYAVTGWPLGDLQNSEEFIEESVAATITLDRFMRANADLNKTVVLGHLGCGEDGGISSITILDSSPKQYDEWLQIISISGQKVGVILESDLADLRDSGAFSTEKLHGLIILGSYSYSGPDSHTTADEVKKMLVSSNMEYCVLVNLAGAQDGIIFTGESQLIRKSGIAGKLKKFEEDSRIISNSLLQYGNSAYVVGEDEREAELYNAAVIGLRDYLNKNNMKTVLVGVSGGIDSSLTATIAADAIGGENVYGVSMPSKYSSDGSKTDAEELMKNLGGHFRTVSIADSFDTFQNMLNLTGLAEENLQARLRGVILMGISNQENHLVLAPGNKSEAAMGYATMYGDTVGGYAVIGDLYKREVYALAEWRNAQGDSPIPESSITKAPSAELRPGQVDSDSLPDYDLLDAFLFDHLENGMERKTLEFKYGVETTDNLLAKLNRSEWKRRQEPMGSKLSPMTFGRDRDMPITR